MKKFLLKLALIFLWPATLFGQDELAPVSRTYALTNVNIVQAPGRRIDMGTIIMKDGLIQSVGKNISVPPEAIVIKADSMYVYAGFIDGLSRAGVVKPKEETNRERVKNPGNPPPDRAGITPQVDVRTLLNPEDKSVEELRSVGFATTHVVPHGVLLPGSGSIVQLGGKSADEMVLASKSSLYSELSANQGVYPSNILGIMAKWRDLYRNAAQARAYESLYASNRTGLERPETDLILEAFYPVVDKRTPVLFKAEKLLDVHRVMTLQTDLGFPLILAGVKEGWDVVSKIKTSNTKIFLSLDLPEEVKEEKKEDKKAEKLVTMSAKEKEALEKRKAEFTAKYAAQASVFQKAGVKFGFTTLDAKTKDIPANLRRMVKAGLSEDAALAALTVNAADLLGLSDRLGTVDNGKIANLVISDKPYFDEKSKVRYVFVDGLPYKIDAKEAKKGDPNAKVEIVGSWSVTTETPQGRNESSVSFSKDGNNFSGKASGGRLPQPVDLSKVELDGNLLKYSYSVSMGSQSMTVEVEVTIEGDTFKGTASVGQYGSFPVEAKKDPQ